MNKCLYFNKFIDMPLLCTFLLHNYWRNIRINRYHLCDGTVVACNYHILVCSFFHTFRFHILKLNRKNLKKRNKRKRKCNNKESIVIKCKLFEKYLYLYRNVCLAIRLDIHRRNLLLLCHISLSCPYS